MQISAIGLDNYIQDLANTQNFNGYGYVLNNPLLYTDPSGNTYGNNGRDFWGCDGGDIGVGPGSETRGSSIDLEKLWKDAGLDKWTKKNLNFKNWGKSISKWFGGGSSGPPPNVSKYVGNLVRSDFAQGFGKMGVQTVIDGFDLISPGFSHMFDSFGGTDYLGIRPTESQKVGYYSAMALTFITPGGAEVGAEKLAVKGLTNLKLVQKAATLAERAIGGTGRFAGTSKHTYANNLLKRYQKIYGDRGLEFNKYFNNGIGNRGYLDVINRQTMTIYDYKFGNAIMGNSQFLKYSRNFEGYSIQIIRP